MLTREVTIENAEGFHVRPAQQFVHTAGRFAATIYVINEKGVKVDGKSILGLMTLGLAKGAKMTIQADGADEREALEALTQLVESKFGEE
ncbi:HPr family phosphocarrier protein [Effusibacillus pohliae]|uniref:HPr family phosphocarrier protein n=1 Tax=Effusibacillus pohliae TaxID=232270 RepID=UPI000375D134|nr:HPr family phosphocarrier protein [Effusibacillus pohliae]